MQIPDKSMLSFIDNERKTNTDVYTLTMFKRERARQLK